MYDSRMNMTKIGDAVEPTNEEWLTGWEKEGIEVRSLPTSEYYWYDYDSLKLMSEYGVQRFAYDDIWNFDWEALRLQAIAEGLNGISHKVIKRPLPIWSELASTSIKKIDNTFQLLKRMISAN